MHDADRVLSAVTSVVFALQYILYCGPWNPRMHRALPLAELYIKYSECHLVKRLLHMVALSALGTDTLGDLCSMGHQIFGAQESNLHDPCATYMRAMQDILRG